MERKGEFSGVEEVFAGFSSQGRNAEPSKPAQPKKPASASTKVSKQKPASKPPTTAAVPRARTGRPPGSQNSERPRVKATIRLDPTIKADFIDWSYERRCSLGDLLEQAVMEFHRRQKAGTPATTSPPATASR